MTMEGTLVDVDKAIDEWDKLYLVASLHVQRATVEKKLLYDKQSKATNDRFNNLSHFSIDIIVR
jgi:hypothetical protein